MESDSVFKANLGEGCYFRSTLEKEVSEMSILNLSEHFKSVVSISKELRSTPKAFVKMN